MIEMDELKRHLVHHAQACTRGCSYKRHEGCDWGEHWVRVSSDCRTAQILLARLQRAVEASGPVLS